MKTLFFPCTLDGLPRESGSRLWRAEWIAKHWDGAAVYNGTQRIAEYNLFVFQKAYLSETVQNIIQKLSITRDNGAKIKLAFDLCDPDFLDDNHREKILHVLPLIDFATSPNFRIVEWLAQYVPAYFIPDGIAMEFITERHSFNETETPTLLWAGYKRNLGAISEIAVKMQELGVRGDILSVEKPVPFHKFHARVAEYDILLNPQPDAPPYCYKSHNKDLLAWASGVAVAHTGEELELLLDPHYRKLHLYTGMLDATVRYSIENTVAQWKYVCDREGVNGSGND